jgi:hypothetical protein
MGLRDTCIVFCLLIGVSSADDAIVKNYRYEKVAGMSLHMSWPFTNWK